MAESQSESRQVVLVVEDEPMILMVVADELRDAGYDVVEAPEADTALDVLETRDDVAVLFTDIALPGQMDGLKLATIACERWPEVKIIVTSGHVRLMLDALPPGGRFVAKPYHSHVLVETIRDVTAA